MSAYEPQQPVTLPPSRKQARKLVNRLLLMEVSTMLAADTPDLVIGARPIWRVPVWIGFLHQGRYAAGTLGVDAQRGALLERAQGVAAIRARAAQIAAALPAYRPNAQVVAESLARDAVRTVQRMQKSTDTTGCCGVTGLSVAVSIRCSLFP